MTVINDWIYGRLVFLASKGTGKLVATGIEDDCILRFMHAKVPL